MKVSSLSSILMITIFLFIDLIGIKYYIDGYIQVVPLLIVSFAIVVLIEILNNFSTLKKLSTYIGNLILSLLDIVIVAYVIGFIGHYAFDTPLHTILNISLMIGLFVELINLFNNKKKTGVFFPG